MILVISIIILLLCIIIYVGYTFIINQKSSYDLFKNLPSNMKLLSNVYDKLKTGDIIYFRCLISEINYELFLSMFTFKHAAFIIKIDGILYITESSTGREYYKDIEKVYSIKRGISITPFFTRLVQDQSLMYISELDKPLSIEYENQLINFAKNAETKKFYPSTSILLLAVFLNIKLKKEFYCFMYVYELLLLCGLIIHSNKSHTELSYFVNDIYKYRLQNNNYNYPYKLIYDI